jgi:hypothetical protein
VIRPRPGQPSSPLGIKALLIACLLGGFDVGAQEPTATLRGVVRNESGRPVEQAQVLLNPGNAQREVRTDRDGRFGFIASSGTHRLRVLRIGFQPRDTTFTVAGATDIVISLQRLTSLTEVAVRARPTGLYGTVLSRDLLEPIAGARVELLGGNGRDTTNASGAFTMGKAKAGTFLLRVSSQGFVTRTMSVAVPRDSGVGMDIVLVPGSAASDVRMEGLWADMAQRRNWSGANSAFVGRDELLDRGKSLEVAMKFAPSFAKKGLAIDERACVYVDGVPRPNASIRDFNVDDIESIEVYGRRGEMTGNLGKKWPRGVPCGNPGARPAPGNRASAVVIWLRK